ncbi:cystinosin homolog isoform X2 [Malus domestica]|uniref:cystinosin homolog isoform X2 n=1 Tax=Malus domestica TaxID=3750 RepID=UPI0039758523
MASWNSIPLEVAYQVLGWTAFVSWSFSFYPQVILNFRRKSVVGLSIDFVVLNVTKHSSYLIYNATLYFSSVVQKQYFEKYGEGQRGSQKVSKIAIGIVLAVWLGAAVCFFVALPTHSWLWLINIFSLIQVFMTVTKYTPQAFMNFMRKSTDGLSIGYFSLDFSGGVTNYAQMAVQSIDQDSWVNFYGNMGKMLLSMISVSFDILFMCQRFLLYPSAKAMIPRKLSKESSEPLLQSSDHAVHENV